MTHLQAGMTFTLARRVEYSNGRSMEWDDKGKMSALIGKTFQADRVDEHDGTISFTDGSGDSWWVLNECCDFHANSAPSDKTSDDSLTANSW